MVLQSYLRLIIPEHLLIPACGITAGYLISGGALQSIGSIILPVLSFALILGGFNSLNAVTDEKIDLINKPARPVPSRKLAANQALVFSFIFYLGGVLLFLLGDSASLIPLFLIVFATLLYTLPPIYLKKRFLLSNINAAFIYVLIPLIAGYFLVGNHFPVPLFIFFTILALGIASVKDIEDYLGDKVYNINTLPVVFGPRKSALLISYIIISSFVFLIVLFSFGQVSQKVVIPLIISIVISVGLINKIYKDLHSVIRNSKKDVVYHTSMTRWAILAGCVIELTFAAWWI